MDSFKNKTIAVVGGSKGLGLTLSQTLLEKGANVIVLSRSEGQLSGLRDQYPSSLSWYASDISDYQQVGEVFTKIARDHPKLDSLVLNAAMTTPRYFVDITEEDVANNLGVNVSGMIYCLQKAVPLLEGGRAVRWLRAQAAHQDSRNARHQAMSERRAFGRECTNGAPVGHADAHAPAKQLQPACQIARNCLEK